MSYVLAIDQGTTSSRAIVFNAQLDIVSVSQEEFPQYFPKPGWVEHNPEDIWQTVLSTCRQAIKTAGLEAKEVASIGITNQRETTVVWDRRNGKPLHNAIVWQDRRTADQCQRLKEAGYEAGVTSKTGLLLDPYFSATKIGWILDNVAGARELAEIGNLAFGTIDTFLLWHLTGGVVHATDATNAARTLLYNIHQGGWDDELLDLFKIPCSLLPEVKNSADDYGKTEASFFGEAISIRGVAGDQQAAAIGQACFKPGMMKSTYGTGCFALLNTGGVPVVSQNKLITTVAYQLDGKATYALEGSIFIAGAAVQWLRDGLGIIDHAEQSGGFAQEADENQNVYMVPAFVGLGAPYWDAEVRGAIYGLTRGTGPKELARAALEAVCYQTRDLLEAMKKDWAESEGGEMVLRVDGGMAASDWTMQFLADILNAPVDRPMIMETTAVGAAYLAGMHCGIYPYQQDFAKTWKLERRFIARMDEEVRQEKYLGWQDAIRRTLNK